MAKKVYHSTPVIRGGKVTVVRRALNAKELAERKRAEATGRRLAREDAARKAAGRATIRAIARGIRRGGGSAGGASG